MASTSENLLLDSNIRDWVVLPLLVIMITAGLLRHHLGQLLKFSRKPLAHKELRTKSCLQRASRLRSGGGGFLSKSKWEARRRYLCTRGGEGSSAQQGMLREEADKLEELAKAAEEEKANESSSTDDLMANNPMNMAMDGMKGNMAFMIQNMVMMQGISHFFKGYVLLKVPFPLTNGFKMMFQRGLDLTTLETSYVSSVSWYFLVMFGLRGFFRLAIGDMPQEAQESVQMQRSFGISTNGTPPQQFNCERSLWTEADNLEIARYHSVVEEAEKRLLGKRYPKKKRSVNGGGAGGMNDIFGLGKGETSKKRK